MNFSSIKKHIDLSSGGPLPKINIYDTKDADSIWAQLDTIVGRYITAVQSLPKTTKSQPTPKAQRDKEVSQQFNEPIEEQNEELEEFEELEEQEELDLARPTSAQLADAELKIQLDESESDHVSEPQTELTEYQKKKQELLKTISKFETEITAKKSWRLMGETNAAERPENELLEDQPDFQIKQKPKLLISEEINKQIDELVKQRVLDKNYNNIERKVVEEKEAPRDLSTDKAAQGLATQLKIGVRTEVAEEVKKVRQQAIEAYSSLDTELRSYFVNGYFIK